MRVMAPDRIVAAVRRFGHLVHPAHLRERVTAAELHEALAIQQQLDVLAVVPDLIIPSDQYGDVLAVLSHDLSDTIMQYGLGAAVRTSHALRTPAA